MQGAVPLGLEPIELPLPRITREGVLGSVTRT